MDSTDQPPLMLFCEICISTLFSLYIYSNSVGAGTFNILYNGTHIRLTSFARARRAPLFLVHDQSSPCVSVRSRSEDAGSPSASLSASRHARKVREWKGGYSPYAALWMSARLASRLTEPNMTSIYAYVSTPTHNKNTIRALPRGCTPWSQGERAKRQPCHQR